MAHEDKNTVYSILEKMGYVKPEKKGPDKCKVKLLTLLESKGAPDGLTEGEAQWIREVGFDPSPKGGSVAVMEDDDEPGDAPEEMLDDDDNDEEDGDDEIAEQSADEPEDDPEPEMETIVTESHDQIQSKKANAKNKAKRAAAKAGKKSPKATAKKPAPAKAVKAPKAAKKSKAEKNPKAEGSKSSVKKGVNATEVFTKMATSLKKPANKAEFLKKLMETTGCSEISAKAYVCWAKRPITKGKNASKAQNPYEFRLEEQKDANGVKTLMLV